MLCNTTVQFCKFKNDLTKNNSFLTAKPQSRGMIQTQQVLIPLLSVYSLSELVYFVQAGNTKDLSLYVEQSLFALWCCDAGLGAVACG